MLSSEPKAAKLKVFVSYSRSDIRFADQLAAALTACGIVPSLDREGIHGAEKWQDRLVQLILEADTIVFILTPQSATSEVCKWEVEQAAQLNKRIVPIVAEPLGEVKPHEHLRGLNYIFFYEEPAVTGSGWGNGLAQLTEALTTDVIWVREHTRLGELAARWARDGRPHDALLRGQELARTLEWRKAQPSNVLEPTPLQREFLAAAEEAEAARANAERRQLEEMRKAQDEREKALAAIAAEQKARANAQRRNRWFVGAAALLALLLFAGATWQSRETERREALVMTSAADKAIKEGHYERAMRIAIQGLPKTRALPLLSLGWEAPEILGLEAKLAGAAQASPLRMILQGHSDAVASATLSRDDSRIVTASWDKTARVWDAKNGQALLILEGHADAVNTAAFSRDDTRIVTASWDKTARVWDARTGQPLLSLEGHKEKVTTAAFSPDGTRVVTASDDKSARVWDARTGQGLLSLEGHAGPVNSAVFSIDGARIVTASDDKTARVWDASTGQALLSLDGHKDPVNSAAFSPDGTRIVTASGDTTAKVWDARTGQVLLSLEGHKEKVSSAAFSADSMRIVTASGDTTTRVWDAGTGPGATQP